MKTIILVCVLLGLSSSARADDLAGIAVTNCDAHADPIRAPNTPAVVKAVVNAVAIVVAIVVDKPAMPADMIQICSDKDLLQQLTKKHLPPQYLAAKWAMTRKGVCDALATSSRSEDQKTVVREICGTSVTHPTDYTIPGFSSVAINLVLGLGDHLEAQAKTEAIAYLLESIGKQFCKLQFPVRGATPIKVGDWFSTSCKVMFPNGLDKDADPDSFSFGALKAAFVTDLKGLPKNVVAKGTEFLNANWPNGKYYIAVLAAIGYVGYEFSQHKSIPEILDDLDDKVENEIKKANSGVAITCDLTANPIADQAACFGLLAFKLVRVASDDYTADQAVTPDKVITDTLDAFCVAYGVSGKTADGACVIDPNTYEDWHRRLLTFYRAIRGLLQLNDNLKAQLEDGKLTPHEIGARSAIDYSERLRALFDSYMDIALNLPGIPGTTDATQLGNVKTLGDLGFDAFAAIVGDDPGALRKTLGDLLSSPILGTHLSASQAHLLTSLIALGTAKDRAEVKEVLKDIAAPAGTYKMKNHPDHWLITINGFVGMLGGAEWRYGVRDATGARAPAEGDIAPARLTAPVGIDFGIPSSRNIGVTFTFIDPLALDVNTQHDTVNADWKTVLEPGAYVRFGLGGSPFAVLAGVNYAVGRRGDATCGGQRCFDGALEVGLLLSVDVPLFVLH